VIQQGTLKQGNLKECGDPTKGIGGKGGNLSRGNKRGHCFGGGYTKKRVTQNQWRKETPTG